MDSKVEFLFLNEEDMIKAGVLDADRAVDTIGEVITLLSEGDYLMGGRAHNDHGVQLIFPEKSDIPNFPLADSADRRFMATLNDVETGQPLAYMSANLLSAMRTGAMPGLTAMYLARKDSKVLTILGAGVIGRTSLMAIMAKFPDLEVLKIKGSSKTSHTAHELADYARENYKSLKEIIICDTLEEAVRDADIIAEAVSVEPRKWPVIDPAWVKPGCTIISSGTMDMDLEFVRDHVTKVVDNIQMYEEYVNVYQEWDEDGNRISLGTPGIHFVNMVTDGWIEKSEIRHLGNIMRGLEPGRTSDDEIFLVSLGGMPILDVGWGYECYQRALSEGIGTKLKLWDMPYMR